MVNPSHLPVIFAPHSTSFISFVSPGGSYPGINLHDVLSSPTDSSWGGDPNLLSARPFADVRSEKLSLDLGGWVKEICGVAPFQVRFRAGKEKSTTRTLREVVMTIVELLKKRMNGALGSQIPDLLSWHLTALHQKTGRKATFYCFFTVEGHTRLVHSHEKDVPRAKAELLPISFPMVPQAHHLYLGLTFAEGDAQVSQVDAGNGESIVGGALPGNGVSHYGLEWYQMCTSTL